HQPSVMDVLRATERLARPRAQLTLEEVGEGLLDDVADSRKITLLDAADLDFRRTPVGILTDAIDRRPHAGVPARSSSRVLTAEWSSPPRPWPRSALNSPCTTAVAGSGTPSARADSMIRPRSLKCRSILNPGL